MHLKLVNINSSKIGTIQRWKNAVISYLKHCIGSTITKLDLLGGSIEWQKYAQAVDLRMILRRELRISLLQQGIF